jgi:hypothetical protein
LNAAGLASQQLKNPILTNVERGNLQDQLQKAVRGIQSLEAQKAQIIARQSKDGETMLTSQRRDAVMAAPNVTIIVQGKGFDEKAIAAEVTRIITGHMNSALNHYTSSRVG